MLFSLPFLLSFTLPGMVKVRRNGGQLDATIKYLIELESNITSFREDLENKIERHPDVVFIESMKEGKERITKDFSNLMIAMATDINIMHQRRKKLLKEMSRLSQELE